MLCLHSSFAVLSRRTRQNWLLCLQHISFSNEFCCVGKSSRIESKKKQTKKNMAALTLNFKLTGNANGVSGIYTKESADIQYHKSTVILFIKKAPFLV